MKTKLKIVFFFLSLFLFGVGVAMSQPPAYFVHYASEDGLPQHTVTDILQDRKGFMWFSTWAGLSKFDGYTFTTYHLPSGEFESRSSRVDRLYEDKYNNIWVLSYDNRAYRFNVDTESFMGTNSVEAYKNKNYYVSEIISTGSGKVWLLSEKEGCISIIDSMFNAEVYSTRDHNLTGDFVHTIHEDMHRNSWILTDKGLTFLPADGGGTLFYFHALSDSRLKEEMPFFSVMESGNEL
jgi:ligand-binding sensor domain-containing protein